MDLKQLLYFVTVAEAGSFTQAARKLHLTQPSLSKMVRLLEEELGVLLLDRSAKPLELTDAGAAMLKSARQVLQSVERMSGDLAEVMTLKKGKLHLGIPPMIGSTFLPPVIERFLALYPDIRLQVTERGGKRLEEDILQGELDFGMVILPVKDEAKFCIMPCLHQDLLLVTDKQHAFANRQSVQIHELEDESFVMFREDFTLHHLIKEQCLLAGYEPRIVLESSQWDFMTEMIASRYGITLLPEGICRQLDPNRFAAIAVEPAIPWRLSMIWRKDRAMSFAAKEWIRHVEQALQERKR
ncbi:LysR substrate-binding domain-containing protein [Paenibacillus methanolicus]|uniref:DNA-binding transcriptional LysR family regulator n=1 Tax=Paenibacillus methanolicus TaxID=582686 RepID=A0A5S5CMD4_9BACL|nr:LysR family transcriptional regulator [Paenibacillus methanolicus]TYP79548.1 DNA-binding transcriptional LysR family regulator [Paenibacillus methanolicus]